MREKLNPDNVSGDNSTLRQVNLVWGIRRKAYDLSSRLQEGVIWRLSTEFSKPPSILRGQDMSEKLHAMVQNSPELLVRLHSLPGIFEDEGAQQVPSYVLEIYSPQENLPGFGLTIVCPKRTVPVTPANLENHKKSGSVDVNLSWSEGGEENAPPDDIARLETALWVLKGLKTADKKVHAQNELVKPI